MAKQRKSAEPALPEPLPKGKTIIKKPGPGLEDPRVLRPGPGDPTAEIDLETDLEPQKGPDKLSHLAIRRHRRVTG